MRASLKEACMAGQFFGYDVMTTDTAAAAKFYGEVVGWGTRDASAPGMQYTAFTLADDRGVAGLMPIPEDAKAMGVGPAWMGYILVDDVDDMVGRIVAEGGKLHKGPITVPGVIRFAVMGDPHGAGFLIAAPIPQDAPPSLANGMPGTIGWHELYAGDLEPAFAFYSKLFGWTKEQDMPMGPMGAYRLFKTGGETATGGMMTKPPQVPMLFWGFYFSVAGSIDAAIARVTKGGGKIINGPMEVPGGDWIVQALDPQGAYFALVAAGR
jgi:predicted enzyme related to lactoylglutathione lyase